LDYPPHLLDELARVFARVALDRHLKESAAREPRQEGTAVESRSEAIAATTRNIADEQVRG